MRYRVIWVKPQLGYGPNPLSVQTDDVTAAYEVYLALGHLDSNAVEPTATDITLYDGDFDITPKPG